MFDILSGGILGSVFGGLFRMAPEVLKFFDWAFKNGKKDAADLDYVSLPDSLTKQIRERVWTQIK